VATGEDPIVSFVHIFSRIVIDFQSVPDVARFEEKETVQKYDIALMSKKKSDMVSPEYTQKFHLLKCWCVKEWVRYAMAKGVPDLEGAVVPVELVDEYKRLSQPGTHHEPSPPPLEDLPEEQRVLIEQQQARLANVLQAISDVPHLAHTLETVTHYDDTPAGGLVLVCPRTDYKHVNEEWPMHLLRDHISRDSETFDFADVFQNPACPNIGFKLMIANPPWGLLTGVRSDGSTISDSNWASVAQVRDVCLCMFDV